MTLLLNEKFFYRKTNANFVYQKMMSKTKTYLIRLTEKEHISLKKEAKERNIPLSQLIRQACRVYIRLYNAK